MLSTSEKEQLKNRAKLEPKARANLDYRIAKKVKKRLKELEEVNKALCSIPEKNAMRVLDDDMVNSIFKLTENMLRILRFSPVVTDIADIRGSSYVVRFGPGTLSKDNESKEFKVKMEASTAKDLSRQFLVEDHIETLQRFIDPITGTLDKPLRPLDLRRCHDDFMVSEALDRYDKWGRPGQGPRGKLL